MQEYVKFAQTLTARGIHSSNGLLEIQTELFTELQNRREDLVSKLCHQTVTRKVFLGFLFDMAEKIGRDLVHEFNMNRSFYSNLSKTLTAGRSLLEETLYPYGEIGILGYLRYNEHLIRNTASNGLICLMERQNPEVFLQSPEDLRSQDRTIRNAYCLTIHLFVRLIVSLVLPYTNITQTQAAWDIENLRRAGTTREVFLGFLIEAYASVKTIALGNIARSRWSDLVFFDTRTSGTIIGCMIHKYRLEVIQKIEKVFKQKLEILLNHRKSLLSSLYLREKLLENNLASWRDKLEDTIFEEPV